MSVQKRVYSLNMVLLLFSGIKLFLYIFMSQITRDADLHLHLFTHAALFSLASSVT